MPRAPSRQTAVPLPPTRRTLRLAAAALALSGPVAARAQTMLGSGSQFNHGAAASLGAFNAPVDVSTRDASGNTAIVNGVTQTASSGGVFQNYSGASSSASGAGGIAGGYGQATAIGNNLSVVTDGSYNTVIVNATQTNTGAVSASTTLNGKVNLDVGQ